MEPPAHLKNMQGLPGQPSILVLQTRGSKFVKFQEVRIQELADEVWRPLPRPASACPAPAAALAALGPVSVFRR